MRSFFPIQTANKGFSMTKLYINVGQELLDVQLHSDIFLPTEYSKEKKNGFLTFEGCFVILLWEQNE